MIETGRAEHGFTIGIGGRVEDPARLAALREAVFGVLRGFILRYLGSEEGTQIWTHHVEQRRLLQVGATSTGLRFEAPDPQGQLRTEAAATLHWVRLAAAAQVSRLRTVLTNHGAILVPGPELDLGAELRRAGARPFVELRRMLWEVDPVRGTVESITALGQHRLERGQLSGAEQQAVDELISGRTCGCDTCSMLRPSTAFEASMRQHFSASGADVTGRASAAWYLAHMASPSDDVLAALLSADADVAEPAARAMTELAPRMPQWRSTLEAASASPGAAPAVAVARAGLSALGLPAAPPKPAAPPVPASAPPAPAESVGPEGGGAPPREALLDRVKRWLVEDEWPIQKVTDTSVRSGFTGKNGVCSLVIFVRESYEQIVCYALPAIVAPEPRRAAMAELVARINYGTILGCFELDFDDGETR